MLRNRKRKWDEVLARCGETEFTVSEASLHDWMSHVREDTTPILQEKGSEHRRSLDGKYVAVIFAWFLQKNNTCEKPAGRTSLYATSNEFWVCIVQLTAGGLLSENWLTLKLSGHHSIRSSLPIDKPSQLSDEEVLTLDMEGIQDYPLECIWIIDVTMTALCYELPWS